MCVDHNLARTETTFRIFLGLFSTEQRQSSTSGSSRLSGCDDGRWFPRRFLISSDDPLLVDNRVHCYLRFFLKYKKALFYLVSTKTSSRVVFKMNSPHGRADETRTPTNDSDSFIGKEQLLGQFARQLQQFEQWNDQRDWLAFHNHHYDWWMFPSELSHARLPT